MLFLLLVANGSPLVLGRILHRGWQWPVDGGLCLPDGKRLFGSSKTVAGLAVALGSTTLCGVLLGPGARIGFLIGVFAMLGDLLSSFVKRRLGLNSGDGAPGLDQIPESLLPLWVCKPVLGLSWVKVLLITAAFVVTNLLASWLMRRSGPGRKFD